MQGFKKLPAISLFTGVAGLDLGLHEFAWLDCFFECFFPELPTGFRLRYSCSFCSTVNQHLNEQHFNGSKGFTGHNERVGARVANSANCWHQPGEVLWKQLRDGI